VSPDSSEAIEPRASVQGEDSPAIRWLAEVSWEPLGVEEGVDGILEGEVEPEGFEGSPPDGLEPDGG